MKESTGFSDLIRSTSLPLDLDRSAVGAKYHGRNAGGIYLYTDDHSQIMDFTLGLTGHNLGYNHPKVLNAAVCQMEMYARSGGFFDNSRTIFQLKNSLAGNLPSGLDSFFFTNTDSEAVKYALWLAQIITNRSVVIRISYSPDGQLTGSTITSHPTEGGFRDEDELPGLISDRLVLRNLPALTADICPETILSELESRLQDLVCSSGTLAQVSAMIVELGGERNGFIPPPPNVLSAVRSLCDQHGILLILDEGRAAVGRTGLMFASQLVQVDPDLIVAGNGLANEYPLGFVVIKYGRIFGMLEGQWNTTEIDPISCAAALAVLNIIDAEDLLCNSRQMGSRLRTGLQVLQKRFPMIGAVRGAGLNCALEIVSTTEPSIPCSSAASTLVNLLLDHGLLVHRAGAHGNLLCLLPPLNVTEGQVNSALNILEQCLERL
jgi:4-aminobutyrate aminotransferase-like enzyme